MLLAAAGQPGGLHLFKLPPPSAPVCTAQAPTQEVDKWLPLGKGEFSNEDGCVSVLLLAGLLHLGPPADAAALAPPWPAASPPWPAPRLRPAANRPPILPFLWQLSFQGGGFGEIHIKATYWPFELMRGHLGERPGGASKKRRGREARGRAPAAAGRRLPLSCSRLRIAPRLAPTPAFCFLTCRGQAGRRHHFHGLLRRPAARRPAHRLLRSLCRIRAEQGGCWGVGSGGCASLFWFTNPCDSCCRTRWKRLG